MRSSTLKRSLQALLVCVAMITMLGAGDSGSRFDRLGHEMMCACSCGQILLECNHVGCPDSDRMIGELRSQLGITSSGPGPATGSTQASDANILSWFSTKYGAVILAAPIRGGFDNVAWITPISLFLLAIIGTAVIVRLWSRRRQPVAVAASLSHSQRLDADELRNRIRRETEY